MSLFALGTAIELGLIYGIMTLGLYVSYRILNVPDLTVDGSFTLGAAVSVGLTVGGHPILGLFLGMLAGACAGIVTGLLQTKLKMQPILAGILTMTGLFSINIMIMGNRSNVSILKELTVFKMLEQILGKALAPSIIGIVTVSIVIVFLVVFLHSQLGLAIRATGDNEDMVRASSINVDLMKVIGLALANSMVGLSGALLAQLQKFSDSQMGIGMVIIGLASLIIGEVTFGKLGEYVLKRTSILIHTIAVVMGSIIYRWIIAIALDLNISASSMKLVSAIIVTLAISYPVIQDRLSFNKLRKRGEMHA